MSPASRTTHDQPLFPPAEIGLDAESWDALQTDTDPVSCQDCKRTLRSEESRVAGIGPCCAAKLGRAVARGRIRAGPADPPPDQPQSS